MKELLLARWDALSNQEKAILASLALVVLCLMFYAFLWLPVQRGSERLTRDIPVKQAKLLLMRAQAADIERLRGQYKLLSGSPNGLKAAVEVSAKFHGLAPHYPTQAKGSGLEIVLNQTSFDIWIKWAESLQSQNRVRVKSCRITPEGAAGQVRVEAVFTASE